jgi:hypothetical protein
MTSRFAGAQACSQTRSALPSKRCRAAPQAPTARPAASCSTVHAWGVLGRSCAGKTPLSSAADGRTLSDLEDRRRATALAGLDPDLTAPFARQLTRDRKAEPVAGGARHPGTAAAKALEHHLSLAGEYAGTLVAHLDPARAGRNRHGRNRRGIVQGVFEQGIERALEVGTSGSASLRILTSTGAPIATE